MNLRVLRGEGGDMMKLVKYQLEDGTTESAANTATLIHNHNLDDGSGGSGTAELIKKNIEITTSPSQTFSNLAGLTPTNAQYVFDKDLLTSVSTGSQAVITVGVKNGVTSGSGRILVYSDLDLIGYIDYTINISG